MKIKNGKEVINCWFYIRYIDIYIFMNKNNDENQIENISRNEEDNFNDIESKKFINSKEKSENKNFQKSFEIIFKLVILIFFLFKYSYLINRVIQRVFLGNKSYLITSEKILWKNNSIINLTKIEEEIKMYANNSLNIEIKDNLYKRDNPKVSLIIPVYNQESFIKKIYSNILNQILKDIEIIFVDDFSTDNSSKIIEEIMKEDKRIVNINNKENKGAFYSRNIGVLNSKGEYILCVDIDDFLLNDILIKSYETAKLYDLDILQFYVMAGDLKKNIFWKV